MAWKLAESRRPSTKLHGIKVYQSGGANESHAFGAYLRRIKGGSLLCEVEIKLYMVWKLAEYL